VDGREETDAAALAAIDDTGGDSRRLRASAFPAGNAAAGGCRDFARGKRLAGRHQCNTCAYLIQFTQRRFSKDRRRPGADAYACDPGGSRRKNSLLQAASVFRGPRGLGGKGGELSRPLVRREIQKRWRRGRACRTALEPRES